jgi:hypothetical protein
MKTIVINKRHFHEFLQANPDRAGDFVYIGRPSIWGNPFKIGKDGTREEVIDQYRNYILLAIGIDMREKIKRELKGKVLVCWCKPEACHGDVLVEIAES